MSLISDLRQRPANLSVASRFTSTSGLLYMTVGLMLLAWPDSVQTLFQDPPFVGQERTLARVIGMTVLIIGWFYYFGGRSGGRQFVAATIVDRVVLVPLVLIPVALGGTFPNVMLAFAALDPLLAVVTWRLLSKSEE